MKIYILCENDILRKLLLTWLVGDGHICHLYHYISSFAMSLHVGYKEEWATKELVIIDADVRDSFDAAEIAKRLKYNVIIVSRGPQEKFSDFFTIEIHGDWLHDLSDHISSIGKK